MVESRIGTKITVKKECYSSTFTISWDSQPSVRDIPVGNIMLSSSILLGDGSPTKVLKILKHEWAKDMLFDVYESPKEVSTYCCAEDIPTATATIYSAEQHQS